MKKKLFEIPITDVLEVRLGGALLTISNPNAVQSNSASSGYDDEYDLGTI